MLIIRLTKYLKIQIQILIELIFIELEKNMNFKKKYLYNNYINQAEQNIKCDSKAFWKFVNAEIRVYPII